MSKLNNDSSSLAARPSTSAVAKGVAKPSLAYQAHEDTFLQYVEQIRGVQTHTIDPAPPAAIEEPPSIARRALVLPPLPPVRQLPISPPSAAAPEPSVAQASKQIIGGNKSESFLPQAAQVDSAARHAVEASARSPGLVPRHMVSPRGRQISLGSAIMRGAQAAKGTARRLESAFGDSSTGSHKGGATGSVGGGEGVQTEQSGSQASVEGISGVPVAHTTATRLSSYLQQALEAGEGGRHGPPACAVVAQSRESLRDAATTARQAPSEGDAAAGGAQISMVQPPRTEGYAERLPPMSQLDASVLDALPLHVKRELEMAYGAHVMLCAPSASTRREMRATRACGA